MQQYDYDRDGKITFPEFCQYVENRQNLMARAFNQLDADTDGQHLGAIDTETLVRLWRHSNSRCQPGKQLRLPSKYEQPDRLGFIWQVRVLRKAGLPAEKEDALHMINLLGDFPFSVTCGSAWQMWPAAEPNAWWVQTGTMMARFATVSSAGLPACFLPPR